MLLSLADERHRSTILIGLAVASGYTILNNLQYLEVVCHRTLARFGRTIYSTLLRAEYHVNNYHIRTPIVSIGLTAIANPDDRLDWIGNRPHPQ
jgi:hypothetical protein